MTQKRIKKVTFFVFALFFIFSLFSKQMFVGASSVPSFEFLPNGLNYIDENNIIYRPMTGGRYKLETISMFRVKQNTEYVFYINDEELLFDEIIIKAYDSNKNFLENKFPNYDRFITSDDTYYISFEIHIIKKHAEADLSNIFGNYFLLEYDESKTLNDYSIDDLEYKGPDIGDLVICDERFEYRTLMSEQITFDELDSLVFAYDNYDGDITSNKEIIRNEYEDNFKAGRYEIEYLVKDSNNNETTLIVDVLVVDDVAPSLKGKGIYKHNQYEKISIETIKAGLTAIDNNDGDITDKIRVLKDEYTGHESEIGNHEVSFCVEDDAGNYAEYIITVMVIYLDDVSPEFSGIFEYTIKNTDELFLEEILANVFVNDNVDGDITITMTIIYDDYTINKGKIGDFKVILEAIDSKNNSTSQEINIHVIDGKKPIFMFDAKNVYIKVGKSNVSTDTIMTYLKTTNNVPIDASYEVVLDEYTENKNTPGKYRLIYKTNDTETRVLVNVVEELYNTEVKLNSYDKLIVFFKNCMNSFFSFIRRLFR